MVTPLVIRERTPVHLPRLKGSLIESSAGCGLVSRVPCACGKSRWAFVHFRPSACRKASAARPSFCSHQQIDFFFRELLEGLELVGGMHVFSGDVVVRLISRGSFAVSMMHGGYNTRADHLRRP